MFPEGWKQCLLAEPISPLVPTKHIITQFTRLAWRKQGLKGKRSETREAFLVGRRGKPSGSRNEEKRRIPWFGGLGAGSPDFISCSVSKQEWGLDPSEVSFPICKTAFFVGRAVSSSRAARVLEPGVRVTLENWLKTLPYFLSGYFDLTGLGHYVCDSSYFKYELF